MPSRALIVRGTLAAALLFAVAACDDGVDPIVEAAEVRAEQTRDAAIEAGLAGDVADFLGLLARGDAATYQVRYPGADDGTELVVTNRPPDRRVEVVAGETTVEVRLVTDGQAFACTPDEDGGDDLTCRRTDAVVDAPGTFRAEDLDALSAALADRLDDYTFTVESSPVAGVDATCLVTRLRSGRESAELGASGTICASPEGAVLLVDQGDDRLEATAYTTEVPDDAFERLDDVVGSPQG